MKNIHKGHYWKISNCNPFGGSYPIRAHLSFITTLGYILVSMCSLWWTRGCTDSFRLLIYLPQKSPQLVVFKISSNPFSVSSNTRTPCFSLSINFTSFDILRSTILSLSFAISDKGLSDQEYTPLLPLCSSDSAFQNNSG